MVNKYTAKIIVMVCKSKKYYIKIDNYLYFEYLCLGASHDLKISRLFTEMNFPICDFDMFGFPS